MGDIPLRYENGRTVYLRDVATPTDANYIQTNVVRVNGKREVYIPVYRQLGASTLGVVTKLESRSRDMEERLTRAGISLKLVMDQSVYVRKSIEALVQEGVLGAILCSLVILLFLGEIRMTAIAIMTLPISVMACSACLYFAGQTINVMTLAGMTLAIGPMIDSAIICLENTHRHLGLGATPHEAAFLGASEVAMPELVSTLCTFLVLVAAGLHAGPGPVPLQADGDGRRIFDDRRLHSVADPGPGVQRVLAQAARAPRTRHGAATADGHGPRSEPATSHAEPETFQINGNGHGHGTPPGHDQQGVRSLAADDRRRRSSITSRGSTSCLRHPVLTIGGRLRLAGRDARR